MHVMRVCSAHVWMAVAVALLMSISVNAATPQLINYQGVLTNPGGTPQVGTFGVTFSIYGVPTGGTALWVEPRSVTTDDEGRFSVLLGSATALTDAVFSGPDRWLGVAVAPDAEVTPRTQIASVAYAERISTVDGAAGGTLSGNLKVGPNDTVFTSNLSSNSPLRLLTGGTTRMHLDDVDGYVGIGTENPAAPLAIVNGTGPGLEFFRGSTIGGVPGGYIQSYNRSTSAYTELGFNASAHKFFVEGSDKMTINSVGDVGIGTSAPGAKLSVNGNALFSGYVGMGIVPSGWRLELPNIADQSGQGLANDWFFWSSGRFKENVTPISDALEKVQQLRGVNFDWKNSKKHDFGFIAEEVGAVIPEVVAFEENGKDAIGISYARLTPLLLEAIKEQQKQIEELRTQVAALGADKQR